jgi:hypothetical protein
MRDLISDILAVIALAIIAVALIFGAAAFQPPI